jgi:hypothetical protein
VITTPNKLFPIDLHGSQLPLVHLLPRRLGAALTRIFRRGLPAGGYLVTYDEVLNILRRQGEYTLLNKFDIFYDIHDFEKNKDKYVRAHTKENKVYLLFSPFIFRLFRLLRIQYNRYAPHLAFIIRKKGP